jgi:predicted kinase
MSTAYLICGYIGVGKTTLAKQLEKALAAVRFTQDEWMYHIYGNYPDEITFTENYTKIYRLINHVWPRCFELGLDVILDLNFWTRASRDETRAKAAALGGGSTLIFLNCEPEIAWSRIQQRNENLENGIYVSQKIFEISEVKLNKPQADEDFINLHT